MNVTNMRAGAPAAVARATDRASVARRPIFLHTGWRSAGTWLWSRFRALPDVHGYSEPLHEILATLMPGFAATFGPASWESGHPDLDHPYFHEYRPLLRSVGGLPLYRVEFATDAFFASADADLPELRAYLAMLLDHAETRQGQAVLKLCRSIGRVGWMQRNFPQAVHIVALRNPATQFRSAQRLYAHHDNPYFLAVRNQATPRVAAVLRSLGVQLPPLPSNAPVSTLLSLCAAQLGRMSPTQRYRAFLAFWTLGILSIPERIDAIVDTDLLTLSPSYRTATELTLAGVTGLPVAFDDVQPTMRVSTGLDLPRDAAWQTHQTVAAILATHLGAAWADTPIGASVAAMLAHADMLAPDGPRLLPARRLERVARLEQLRGRAERAEAMLNALRTSPSWRLTAPLRWLRAGLGSTLHAVIAWTSGGLRLR
jgi:hypothetical protein